MQVQVEILRQLGMSVPLAGPDKIHNQGTGVDPQALRLGVVWHPLQGTGQLRILHQKETAA